jgi:hypothetical protein
MSPVQAYPQHRTGEPDMDSGALTAVLSLDVTNSATAREIRVARLFMSIPFDSNRDTAPFRLPLWYENLQVSSMPLGVGLFSATGAS